MDQPVNLADDHRPLGAPAEELRKSEDPVHAPIVPATFADVKVGSKLSVQDQTLTVIQKDAVSLTLQNQHYQTISFYAPEFDARGFERLPDPPKPSSYRLGYSK